METNKIYNEHCLATLRRMPDNYVHTCITSPPYFGLRDYGHPEQIGLEETPQAFVAKLVEVFQEVRRVLRSDGTLWVNIGDSYANDTKWGGTTAGKHAKGLHGTTGIGRRRTNTGLPSKSMMGIPWRLAFGLQDDGWILRQDIVWHKPNPMPESVTDRCTKSHEYIFLLSKSPNYYYDQEAIKEGIAASSVARLAQDLEHQKGSDRVPGKTNGPMKAVGGSRSKRDSFKRDDSKRAEVFPGQSMGTHRPDRPDSEYPLDRRNKRSVWTVATKPYSEAHFATFPESLIEPCVLAGCPEGGIILDPFMGAGTTALVALRAGRQYIGSELNPDYVAIAERRLSTHKRQLSLFA